MLETVADKEMKKIALSGKSLPKGIVRQTSNYRVSGNYTDNRLHRLGLTNFTIHEIDALTGLAFFCFDSELIRLINQAR